MDSQHNSPRATTGESARLPLPPAGTTGKFVVLHHSGATPEHFDLLIAIDGIEPLFTWRIANAPETWASEGASNPQRVADHRRFYLTYEGPVSGNRGRVRRVAAGTAHIGPTDGRHVQLQLDTRAVHLPIE